MEWLRLKEYGMKNNHIKKLMLIFQDFEELFYEENFKLFNDELKHQLDESMKIDMKERLNLYERNRVRIISANDKEYPKKLKEIKDYPVFLYLIMLILNLLFQLIYLAYYLPLDFPTSSIAFVKESRLYFINFSNPSFVYGPLLMWESVLTLTPVAF